MTNPEATTDGAEKKTARPIGRDGVALIVVLWVMVVLSLMVYSLGQSMRTEYAASVSHADRLKALEVAKSGIDKAIAFVENDPSPVAGPLSTWQSNDTEFESIPVGDGTFTLIHPYFDQEGVVQHGLWDESSKLSLNIANKDMLMKLPGMTEDIADSIIDWRDSDENASPRGAENPYYKSLQPPYACKNGDFETVEELLYVRGMTPEILYGEDTNLNGVLDSNENDGCSTC
jgi:type II secretory pathway component PulK